MSTINSFVPPMPYQCPDLTCECHVPSPYAQEAAHFEAAPGLFIATLRDEDGRTIDILTDHSLSSLVEAVHRNYPHARKAKP